MKSEQLRTYKQTRVKTASQGQIIVMLYNEALRQIENARDELGASSPKLDRAHNAIVKTQEVLTELTVSLDFDKGGEIAQNLFSLYMYFNQRLVDANLNKDDADLEDVHRLMSELRDAWVAIEGTSVPAPEQMALGVNLAG